MWPWRSALIAFAWLIIVEREAEVADLCPARAGSNSASIHSLSSVQLSCQTCSCWRSIVSTPRLRRLCFSALDDVVAGEDLDGAGTSRAGHSRFFGGTFVAT